MEILLFLTLFAVGVNSFYITNGTDPKNRIVGGKYVDIKSVPYLAQLIHNGKHSCGASIISPQWLLTAAHCLDETTNLVMITGSSNRGTGKKHTITKIIIHKDYNPENFNNDISLIKVKYPIKFDELQKPVTISHIPPKAGQTVKLSGFGNEATGVDSEPVVKAGFVSVVDHDKCIEAFEYDDVTENMFCTDSSNVDSCQGDSGGPVVYKGKLVGVVSWGIGCAEDHPGVYTQVANYIDWIRAKTGLSL